MSDDLSARLTALHNQQAGDIVRQIVRPTLDAGGSMASVMVLMESVLAGFALAHFKLGAGNQVIDELCAAAKKRTARILAAEPEEVRASPALMAQAGVPHATKVVTLVEPSGIMHLILERQDGSAIATVSMAPSNALPLMENLRQRIQEAISVSAGQVGRA